jgi:23S rRNA pseudouridine1911/1915/1917 synthase
MELKLVAQRTGRLSSFLKEDMGMSTGLMNRLKWQQKIFVNGISRHNDHTVQPGDVITAVLDEEAPQYPAEDAPVTVLFEDAHILAVDKPAGMLIHPSHATMVGTLANRVVGYYQKTGQNCVFHPVTRLDRDTFGVVLLAKNAHVHALFNRLHREGQLKKTYHALVLGGPAEDNGVIDAPIARQPQPSLLRYVNQEGKSAVTEYVVLERGKVTSLLQLRPITGRTHQLRVHCAYMGFPILGDPQYGNEEAKGYAKTQLLCAKRLEFTHPVTGQSITIESRLPMDAAQ